ALTIASNYYGTRMIEFLPLRCGNDTFDEAGVVGDPDTLVIDSTIKCPIAGKDRCAIQVFNTKSGELIFQDQGDCPCVFEVQCGNCPDEHIECKANHYPGYCCIPCESISQKIHNLANRIQ
ncbi:MAG: hypothetical protein RLZZ74_3596, partial [Cyanobacteriota bacterium]